MYARRVEGETLSLGVSGSLWKDALIMFDRGTGSLWTQVTGEALQGPLEGRRLRTIPSVMTTWKRWREEHPDTLVLVRGEDDVRSERYVEYHASDEEMGIFGTKNPDARLGGKRPVLGVRPRALGKNGSIAYVLDRFAVLNDAIAGWPVVVAADAGPPASGGIYLRTLRGEVLTFTSEGSPPRRAVDAGTGSVWNLLEGVAIEGPLQGTRLEAVPSVTAYWFAWAAFHPQSDLRPSEEEE